MEKQGVKELLEAIAGLKQVALAGKVVLADGKLSFNDLPAVVALLSNAELLAAVDGINQIPSEIKDLDLDEAMQIIGKLVEALKAFKAA